MKASFGRMVVLVRDYDEAFEFYRTHFGCRKIFDETQGGRRYLHVAMGEDRDHGIWFLKPESEEGELLIGMQAATHPALVVYVDSLDEFMDIVQNQHTEVVRQPSLDEDFPWMQIRDLYGNVIVVVQNE